MSAKEYEIEWEYGLTMLGSYPRYKTFKGALRSIARNVQKMGKNCYGESLVSVNIIEHEKAKKAGTEWLPKCDKCGTNRWVVYAGPGTCGSEFNCSKCRIGWEQAA